jgi:hypothetical protein
MVLLSGLFLDDHLAVFSKTQALESIWRGRYNVIMAAWLSLRGVGGEATCICR